jgi:hypothetical protein
MRYPAGLCELDFFGQQGIQKRFAKPVQMDNGFSARPGQFFHDLFEKSKSHETAFSGKCVARAHDTLRVAAVCVLDQDHGGKGEMVPVVRIIENGGPGQ